MDNHFFISSLDIHLKVKVDDIEVRDMILLSISVKAKVKHLTSVILQHLVNDTQTGHIHLVNDTQNLIYLIQIEYQQGNYSNTTLISYPDSNNSSHQSSSRQS